MAGEKISNGSVAVIDLNLSQIPFFKIETFETFGRDGNGQTVAGFNDLTKLAVVRHWRYIWDYQ